MRDPRLGNRTVSDPLVDVKVQNCMVVSTTWKGCTFRAHMGLDPRHVDCGAWGDGGIATGNGMGSVCHRMRVMVASGSSRSQISYCTNAVFNEELMLNISRGELGGWVLSEFGGCLP